MRPSLPPALRTCLCAFALASVAAAQSGIDQEYGTLRQNGLEITGAQSAVQTFTCGRTGWLLRVDVDVRHWAGTATTPLTVNLLAVDSSGVPTNQVLATMQLQASEIPVGAYAYVPVRPLNPLPVTTGLVLGLELVVPATVARAYAWSGDAPGNYAFGTTFIRRTTGPLGFDMGFRTYVGTGAGATGYGVGHPGTNGTPRLTTTPLPILNTSIDLLFSNSANVATQGLLLFGTGRANVPTPFGGSLLVGLLATLPVPLPQGGTRLPLAIPDDPSLCGQTITVQGIVGDAGASHGLAFTAGLELRIDA